MAFESSESMSYQVVVVRGWLQNTRYNSVGDVEESDDRKQSLIIQKAG
jgi:hypothetical protein